MSLYILNDKNERMIVNLDENQMIVGDYKIRGYAQYLEGNATHILGDISNIWGILSQDIDMWGFPTPSLQGDVSKIKGNITGVYGYISSYLIGDFSKIKGNITGVCGDVDKAIAEYLQKNNLTELEDKIDVSLLIG